MTLANTKALSLGRMLVEAVFRAVILTLLVALMVPRLDGFGHLMMRTQHLLYTPLGVLLVVALTIWLVKEARR